jgi:branched-chain amino acid transport system permease protein
MGKLFNTAPSRSWMLWLILALVVLLPFSGETYYIKLVTRMLVFAIAALSLDLLVGYLGLVSFGHAAFVAIGAYTVGIMASMGYVSIWFVWPLAVLLGALFALFVGFISLRCSGLYFIFITLAFAQMVFYGAQSLRAYGGDDGFALEAASTLGPDVALSNPVTLFYTSLAILLACLYLGRRLVNSPFGRIVVATRDNETRVHAVGVDPYPYKLVMFVVSGAIATLAGALMANLTSYVSPGYVTWLASGELLVMVILGSVGTLVGPVLGAAVFVGFEHWLSDITEHWMLIFGPLIVIRVLFLKNGIYGLFSRTRSADPSADRVSSGGHE